MILHKFISKTKLFYLLNEYKYDTLLMKKKHVTLLIQFIKQNIFLA